jgi:C-terminal processing protease CtpA/Prc
MKTRILASGLLWAASFASAHAQAPAPLPAAPAPAALDTIFRRGSGIKLGSLSAQQIENLAVLGRVWGFAKYYHPAVAQGQHNWDAELFRVLPPVLAARSVAERSQVLGAWLARLGPVPACPSCAAPAPPTKMEPDLAWLTDPRQIGPALSAQLTHLRDNRNQDPSYYITTQRGVGNPIFQHEDDYASAPYPDAGYRLLALFRYWNAIEYFFPYKYAIGEDWQRVLPAFIPQLVGATDGTQYRLAVLALMARIHDSHGNLTDKSPLLEQYRGAFSFPGQVGMVQDRAVVRQLSATLPASQSPLRAGDIIMQVAGVPVAQLLKDRQPLTSASNEVKLLDYIAQDLLTGPTDRVAVQVLRDGRPLALEVPRYRAVALASAPLALTTAAPDSSYRWLPGNIGYLNLGRLTTKQVAGAMRTFAGAKGLVMDLRSRPDFGVYLRLPAYLVAERTPYVKFALADLTYPGRFTYLPVESIKPGAGPAYPGKVMVLVNEGSRSLAEYFAMTVRATPHATVVGSTTAAADGDVSYIPLPGGLSCRLSGVGVYYPDGRETQRIGIVPDVVVHPTIAGLRAHQDEVLDKAVQLLGAGT